MSSPSLCTVQAEAFIALPGGVGTMEELTEILTWAKLKLHNKPVALLNTEGYYDHFLKWVSGSTIASYPASPRPLGVPSFLLVMKQAC